MTPGAIFAGTTQTWLMISGDWRQSLLSNDSAEKTSLEREGWRVNGSVLLQAQAGAATSALHRLVRVGTSRTERRLEHDPAKVAALVKSGYTDEGVIGHVATAAKPGLVPVEHFTSGDGHLWLIHNSDPEQIGKAGWTKADVTFWVWPEGIVAPKTE